MMQLKIEKWKAARSTQFCDMGLFILELSAG